jgi:hypothetical protein
MMFLSLLTLLFIALKLTGFIDWSWWFVVMPTLIHASVVVLLIAGVAAFGRKL